MAIKYHWVIYIGAVLVSVMMIFVFVKSRRRDVYAGGKRVAGVLYAENEKYLAATAKFRQRFNREKNMMNQRKTHHIYSCPGCGQKIRIPKGKGKIEIECPKCHTKFVKRS